MYQLGTSTPRLKIHLFHLNQIKNTGKQFVAKEGNFSSCLSSLQTFTRILHYSIQGKIHRINPQLASY